MRWLAAGLMIAGLLIAVAIAVDDRQLSRYQLQVWDLVIKTIGVTALFGGAFRYFLERPARLAWDKTRFMIELFGEFDRSEEYQVARRIIDAATDSGDDTYLVKVLGPAGELDEIARRDRDSIDRYLDFFDRLYTYVFITKTLSPDDVASFWGYAIDIAKRPPLRTFALQWGYEDVLRLARSFEESATKRNKVIERLETERVNWNEP